MKSLARPSNAKGLKNTKQAPLGTAGAIYARYSSHAQKDASIEQQVEQCMAYALDKKISINRVYSDRAITGRTDRRVDFQRMMKDAERGDFSYVIAWKSNRIGRNMLQAMANEDKLLSLGVRVLYVEEDFDDTAAGRFALRSMMNVNQFYSENMAEDIKRGLYDNAANCKITNGTLPLGYKKGDDSRYAIDAPKDEVVRDIFTRVARGDAFVDIAADLNAKGIKTGRGKPWGKNSFQNLVTNERYTGVYIYGDVRIEGGIPQIVSKELFFRVQEVIQTKGNARGRHRINGDYLLTGKLYCAKCGSAMVGVSGRGKHGELHHYYSCQKRRTEKGCDKSHVRRDTLELSVTRAIMQYALQDDILEWIADEIIAHNKKVAEGSHVALMEKELEDNKKSVHNMMKAIEQGIITETTKERLLALEREQAKLVGKIQSAKAEVILAPKEKFLEGLKVFRDGDENDKRFQAMLFDTFLVAVFLNDEEDDPNNLKIAFSFSGDKNTIEIPLIENALNGTADDGASSYNAPLAPPLRMLL